MCTCGLTGQKCRMPGESYRRWLRSFLRSYQVFPTLMNSLVLASSFRRRTSVGWCTWQVPDGVHGRCLLHRMLLVSVSGQWVSQSGSKFIATALYELEQKSYQTCPARAATPLPVSVFHVRIFLYGCVLNSCPVYRQSEKSRTEHASRALSTGLRYIRTRSSSSNRVHYWLFPFEGMLLLYDL